uniref:Actin interacting protein 3-like C-terminal domain-containing protein n=1 Tax=Strigamia maritima TaxID=126957 RepID=T1JCW6_STRMM
MTKSSSESGDPKKDIILGHLQRRFPEYASTIAGHKDQFATMPNPHHYESREWPRIPMVHSHIYGQRGHSMYQPPSSVYDDDPGIMSEVETSATGFRRGGKQRSSLPVVRTPNKTLERPLGLVFLQYRSETKRALLPNEITSLDTVKALFVRSFSKQLTMEYLDSTHIRIYIHDPSKDMFYELEDLRDIRDRSVLRIYEQDMNGGGGGTPSNWDQDMSYFSEPEFDSDYQHQHIHRSKKSPAPPTGSYYGSMTTSYPPSLSVAHTATLPRSGTPMRSYSPSPGMLEKQKSQTLPPPGPIQPPPKPQRTYQQPVTSMAKSVRATPPPQGPPPPAPSPSPRSNQSMSDRRHQQTHESGYHSSPERRMDHHRSVPSYVTPTSSYEEPYYGDRGYGSRSGSVTPIIDEEARLRMQMMERQLANLTGLVHKALTTGRQPSITRDVELNLNREQIQLPSSSSSGTSPGPAAQTARDSAAPIAAPTAPPTTRTEVQLTPEMYNQLRLFKKRTKEMRLEVRNLRRMSQAQAINIKETIRETFLKIKVMLAAIQVNDQVQTERLRITREEELYSQDVQRLEKDLSELESAVEELRSNVINRRCRVNMSDVESMALVLSRSSKTVADLKARFPGLQEGLKTVMTAEMEVVVQEEKFLKDEPERLENALRRCKKLTGTLAASFSGELKSDGRTSRQENALDALLDELQTFSTPDGFLELSSNLSPLPVKRASTSASSAPTDSPIKGQVISQGPAGVVSCAVPASSISKLQVDIVQDIICKVSAENEAGKTKKVPPPPPPRTSSKSPLTSPTSQPTSGQATTRSSSYEPIAAPMQRSKSERLANGSDSSTLPRNFSSCAASKKDPTMVLRTSAIADEGEGEGESEGQRREQLSSNSSSSESVNSQEGVQGRLGLGHRHHTSSGAVSDSETMMMKKIPPPVPPNRNRKEMLDQRHQELLCKQRQLQEQYARLQQLQRGQALQRFSPPRSPADLKKTGSESNILLKAGLALAPALQAHPPGSGSLTHLVYVGNASSTGAASPVTNKIYETDIL